MTQETSAEMWRKDRWTMTMNSIAAGFALLLACVIGCEGNTKFMLKPDDVAAGIARYCIDGVVYVRPVIGENPFTLLVDASGKPRLCTAKEIQ